MVFSIRMFELHISHTVSIHQVACVLGIMGASRRSEFVNLKLTDIQLHGSIMIMNVRDTKNHKPRSYVLSECYTHIIDKYQKLRPPFTTIDRFILNHKRAWTVLQPDHRNKYKYDKIFSKTNRQVCLLRNYTRASVSDDLQPRF
jgi:integrase